MLLWRDFKFYKQDGKTSREFPSIDIFTYLQLILQLPIHFERRGTGTSPTQCVLLPVLAKSLRSIQAVDFANTGEAYLATADAHGAGVL